MEAEFKSHLGVVSTAELRINIGACVMRFHDSHSQQATAPQPRMKIYSGLGPRGTAYCFVII